MGWLIDQLVQERAANRPGAPLAAAQLSQLLFIHVLRNHMAEVANLPPGWLRALWTTPGFGFFWIGVAVLIRYLAHWHPFWKGVPLVTIGTVSFPLGFLIGIGAFDYWAYYY